MTTSSQIAREWPWLRVIITLIMIYKNVLNKCHLNYRAIINYNSSPFLTLITLKSPEIPGY